MHWSFLFSDICLLICCLFSAMKKVFRLSCFQKSVAEKTTKRKKKRNCTVLWWTGIGLIPSQVIQNFNTDILNFTANVFFFQISVICLFGYLYWNWPRREKNKQTVFNLCGAVGACDVFQKHVKLCTMAETDVSCLCSKRETGICFEYGINLPSGTGAERSGCRHNKSNVTCSPPPLQLHRTLGTCNWPIHMENLCQQNAFTSVVLFPVMRNPSHFCSSLNNMDLAGSTHVAGQS